MSMPVHLFKPPVRSGYLYYEGIEANTNERVSERIEIKNGKAMVKGKIAHIDHVEYVSSVDFMILDRWGAAIMKLPATSPEQPEKKKKSKKRIAGLSDEPQEFKPYGGK